MNNSQEKFYILKCVKCGAEFNENETATSCLKCGEALDVKYDLDYIKRRLNFYALKNSPLSALKYLAFYPILDFKGIVTLNEGGTPLHKAKNIGKKLGLNKLFIKVEGANPTGVFKDRGSLVELTKAKELNAKAVCCASTGNMAASVSAYAAAAGLPCYVLIPEGTPVGKLAQTLSYGARVIQVRGTYADCVRLCAEMAKKYNFYLAGDYVFRAEGQKSMAYEIIEQNFWKAPDFVIVPIGCGTNIAGIWKGFKEFYQLG
ncbi:MAG: pyridoxal-phosphate dependent enzyme, partial [bacterium]